MTLLKVGIFHIQFSDNDAVTLLDVVKTIDQFTGESRTAATIIDDPIRPRDTIQINDQYCLLDFSRIPQIDRIETADLKGNEAQIKFDRDGPKPCKHTAVLLDPHSNTMYVHEARGGIGHTTVAKYLEAAAGLGSCSVSVILNETAGIQRLLDKKHRSFTVKLAGMDNASELKSSGSGDAAILNLLKTYKAPNATITVGLDRKDPGKLENVLETAAALIGWNTLPIFGKLQPVKRITVKAEDEMEEQLINLLDDRMHYVEPVELERGETPTDAHRHGAVLRAFERNRTELRRRFPVTPSV